MPGWDGAGSFVRSDGTRTGAAVCQEQQIAGATIDPVLFDNELNTFASGLENCVTLTGETTPTANLPMGGHKLTGLAAGSSNGDSVRYEQLAEMSPVGCVQMYAGAAAPSGWLLCDGSAVSRTGYASLFSVVGVTYGSGDGSSTFNLPDLRQRFPLGKAASGTGATLGSTGGSIDHVHTGPSHTHSVPALSIPSHTHSVPAHYHGMGTGADLAVALDHDHGAFTSGGESGHTHPTFSMAGNHIRPYNGVNADVNGGGTNGSYDVATSTGASTGHTHTIDVPAFTGSAAPTGRLGLVTGGVDGNSAMTSGGWSGSTGTGTSGAGGTGNTGTANPPYISLNFIIKT